MNIILTVWFAILMANCVSCERILTEPMPGEIIPIDVSVGDGSMTIVSGHPYPPQDFFSQSINLYDFEMQLEARKVLDKGICYVKKFTATLEQIQEALDRVKSTKSQDLVTEELNIPGEAIPENELEATLGAKVARFCSEYDVFWLAESQGHQITGRMTERKTDWSVAVGYSYSGGTHEIGVTIGLGRR